ncbi:MAG: hypothetical protein ACREKH_00110, partial [Candidatus Rokuibacteriota bacterium]
MKLRSTLRALLLATLAASAALLLSSPELRAAVITYWTNNQDAKSFTLRGIGGITGKAGGHTLTGGTGAGDNLALSSTSNATKGKITLGTASAYDEVNDRLGLGTQGPSTALHISSAGSGPEVRISGGSATNPQYSVIAGAVTGKLQTQTGGDLATLVGTQSAHDTSLITGNSTKLRINASTGNVSIGMGTTGGSARLHVATDDATTAATTEVVYIDHSTTGTAAAGIGAGLVMRAEDSTGTMEPGAVYRMVFSNATNLSETSELRIGLRNAGAAFPAEGSEQLRLTTGRLIFDGLAANASVRVGVSTQRAILGITASNVPYLDSEAADQFIYRSGGVEYMRWLQGSTALTVGNSDTAQNLLVGTGTNVASTKLRCDPSKTIASGGSVTWNGVEVMPATVTWTGSTGSTTGAGIHTMSIKASSHTCASALTHTVPVSTLYIDAAPSGTGAGPCTLNQPTAVFVDSGAVRFDGRVLGGKGADVA